MATLWLTYAWEDNQAGDVDYLAQELSRSGLSVKLDRWNLRAGLRLWEQIGDHITNPSLSDAWAIYATQASLGSESCKEEVAYALDRALRSRGQEFPFIGIFPTTLDHDLIPPSIRSRLYVSLTDPDWKERVLAAAERRAPAIEAKFVEPYEVRIHEQANGKYAIEMRPRAGSWSPFIVAVPALEESAVHSQIAHGPRYRIPTAFMLMGHSTGITPDGAWAFHCATNEATPTQSYFLLCDKLPSKLHFGVNGEQPQYGISVQSPGK